MFSAAAISWMVEKSPVSSSLRQRKPRTSALTRVLLLTYLSGRNFPKL